MPFSLLVEDPLDLTSAVKHAHDEDAGGLGPVEQQAVRKARDGNNPQTGEPRVGGGEGAAAARKPVQPVTEVLGLLEEALGGVRLFAGDDRVVIDQVLTGCRGPLDHLSGGGACAEL